MLPGSRTVIRRDGGLYTLERALQRRGFDLVAGADEAGRGACAGPLVVAAVILPPTRRGEVPGLADSKLLTPLAREKVYAEVLARALAYAVVSIPAAEVDQRGLQVCNLAGMRRALAALTPSPHYALTDGFRVSGLGTPGLAVWKGDQVAACVAAASVVAKVTRDRAMIALDEEFPGYGFAEHKGYSTGEHTLALRERGPCLQHRFSYVNVEAALVACSAPVSGLSGPGLSGPGLSVSGLAGSGLPGSGLPGSGQARSGLLGSSLARSGLGGSGLRGSTSESSAGGLSDGVLFDPACVIDPTNPSDLAVDSARRRRRSTVSGTSVADPVGLVGAGQCCADRLCDGQCRGEGASHDGGWEGGPG